MTGIRKSFSKKLSFSLLLLAVPIFIASLGVLFTQSRHMIRVEAVGRANSVLNTTMQRIYRNILTIETATNANSWQVEQAFNPEYISAFTHRIVRLNPHIDGCSVSAEPNVFPDRGRYFSAYSVRESDSITTVIEAEYEYFDKIWYRTPRDLKAPCWVAYYDEADSLELTIDGMIASYGKPLYDADSSMVGIISTDLSLLRLSKVMSEIRPYPNSYFMMLGEDGRFLIHPDSTRLFNETIFTRANPSQHADIIALGHEMTKGSQGRMNVVINGKPCLVCYQPVLGTNWSLAIVCPDSDILAGYYKQTYIVVPLLVIGLFVILLLCHRAVAQTIRPLNELLSKTQSITAGNTEIHIPRSTREDVIGRLQNSFSTMLQSLNFHLGSIRYTSDQTQSRNEELAKATRLAEEADRQKTAFIQNVSHQIRTPLNIIMGFSQVLSDTGSEGLQEEEMKSIIDMMDYNSKLLNRILLMLYDSSDTGFTEELNCHKVDMVSCNEVARESIGYVKLHYPVHQIKLLSEVPDDFCIQTNHIYLMLSLRELLYNSAKYSDGQHITVNISRTDTHVRFVVEDVGKGIDEADRETIFNFFTKVDDLTEGLGLGLPLAKRHILNLGGDIRLDDDYHDGCRFVLELPLRWP